MYFSHNSNIKCLGLIIKYINFDSIHYVVSFSMSFNDFDYMFPSILCLNQLNYFSLKKTYFLINNNNNNL